MPHTSHWASKGLGRRDIQNPPSPETSLGTTSNRGGWWGRMFFRALDCSCIPLITYCPNRPGVWSGSNVNMTATRILIGLEALDVTGPDADTAARMGFLEWAFMDPDVITADKAAAALSAPEAQSAESAAAQAFVGYLRDASKPGLSPRRRGRAARLH